MGSVKKRADRPKLWRARYRGPSGKQHSKSFLKKEAADRWLRNEMTKIDKGTWVDPAASRRPFADWADSWFRGLSGLKPKTVAGYESLLRSRLLPRFGNYQLGRIDAAAVREWIAEMDREGLSPSRIRQARQLLNAIMKRACQDRLISLNPVEHTSAPADRPREMRFLNAAELAAVAGACEQRLGGSGTLINVLGYLGLRWGEAISLRPTAFDRDGGRLTIRESATEVRCELVFGTPKSHRARTVVIPRFLSEQLAAQVTQLDRSDLSTTGEN